MQTLAKMIDGLEKMQLLLKLIRRHRLLDILVVECWHRVMEVPGSIHSQGPPPRYPSGRVLASSDGGPGFNPQSMTASSIP